LQCIATSGRLMPRKSFWALITSSGGSKGDVRGRLHLHLRQASQQKAFFNAWKALKSVLFRQWLCPGPCGGAHDGQLMTLLKPSSQLGRATPSVPPHSPRRLWRLRLEPPSLPNHCPSPAVPSRSQPYYEAIPEGIFLSTIGENLLVFLAKFALLTYRNCYFCTSSQRAP